MKIVDSYFQSDNLQPDNSKSDEKVIIQSQEEEKKTSSTSTFDNYNLIASE